MTNDGTVGQVTLVAGLVGGNGAHIPLGFFVYIF